MSTLVIIGCILLGAVVVFAAGVWFLIHDINTTENN